MVWEISSSGSTFHLNVSSYHDPILGIVIVVRAIVRDLCAYIVKEQRSFFSMIEKAFSHFF